MSAPSVTYTFTNGTTADATQVNTNFTDLINGASDGTKDYSINQLTVNGAATFNGSVTLGNASGDDITLTGSIAASIPIKANNSYDFGSSTLGLLSLYLGAAGGFTTRLKAAATASWTLTLPVTAGTDKYILETNGSGTSSWVPVRTANADLKNVSISASIAASALTVTLKSADGTSFSSTNVGIVPFRSSTATTGTSTERSITSDVSLIVSNGSTLGMASVTDTVIYIYLIDNAGTVELGIINGFLDEGTLQSSTAEGGTGTADSGGLLYSTTARASKAVKLIGRLRIQNTAGAWVSSPTEVSLLPFMRSGYIDNNNATLSAWPAAAGQWGDFSSVTLPAGEWDLTGIIVTLNNGAVTTTSIQVGISTTSGNSSSGLLSGINTVVWAPISLSNGNQMSLVMPNYRVTHTSSTVYYLKAFGGTSITNLQYAVRFSARRIA